jgi:hypothetical protein
MNKKLGTGAPIYGSDLTHPRNPISGFAASLLSAIPGTNVGQTERLVNGKRVYGPGANPLVTYIAQQTPLSNLLVNAESNIKGKQRGGAGKGLLSWLGGVSTYKPDEQAQQTAAQLNEQKAFKQFLRGLRDEKVIPEAKKKKTSANASILNSLSNQAFGGS